VLTGPLRATHTPTRDSMSSSLFIEEELAPSPFLYALVLAYVDCALIPHQTQVFAHHSKAVKVFPLSVSLCFYWMLMAGLCVCDARN
jgi:hypothetical protein